MTGQPTIFRNDWSTLSPPALGEWAPSLSVSVVIPAYDAGALLPAVLAGLAAQTYPDHLLEVVVADDGPGELILPEVRPERTRVVRVRDGWGRASACHAGATEAEGDVLHWLDADMLLEREHVEAQLRWHHLIDYAVVLGHKWFVDPGPATALAPADLRALVASGPLDDLFPEREPHDWIEQVYDRTRDLRDAGPHALRTHVGATASLHRSLYLRAGGMDVDLKLGEDIDLGYRLAEAGAVFVPDRAARSWHLGASHVMRQREQVNAYNDGFLADRVPDLRAKRRPGRSYRVPYLDVVLDTAGQPHEQVTAVVDACLASVTAGLPDLVVTLLGDWPSLGAEERRSPLADPLLDARIVHAHYAHEPRVRLLPTLPPGPPDAMWRLTLPDAGWAPRRKALAALVHDLDRTHDGEAVVILGAGEARLVRTAAPARADRLGVSIDEVAGSVRLDADPAGFAPVADVPHPHLARTGGPPQRSVLAAASDDARAPAEPAPKRRLLRRTRVTDRGPTDDS